MSLVPAPALATGDLELLSIFGRGDPMALAVDEDEAFLVLANGCLISVHAQHEDAPYISEELASTTLDATIFEMTIAGPELFVAGGSAGLFSVAWKTRNLDASRVAAAPPGIYTALATTQAYLLATSVTLEGARLLVFSRGELALLESIELPARQAWAVVARNDTAWVAAGEAGCFRVQLQATDSATRVVRVGPDRALTATAGLDVRDLALSGNSLHAAADGAHFRIDLGPEVAGRDACAVRVRGTQPVGYMTLVAANKEDWFMARLRGPSTAAAGAPYGRAGVNGLNREIAGLPRETFVVGKGEWIESGIHAEPLRVRDKLKLPTCGFRSLEAGKKRLYGQLLRLGAVVWDCEGGTLKKLWSQRPAGQPLIDGTFSLADPDVLFFGVDSTGSRVHGFLEVGPGTQLRVRPASKAERPLGLRIGANWYDSANNCEWFLAGRFFGWQLMRFRPGFTPEITRWEVQPPRDPNGKAGATYFSSVKHGDLLLGSRSASRHGLVGWSASTMVQVALATPAGEVLDLPELFQARTQDGGGPLQNVHAWSVSVARCNSGSLAVVPAGRVVRGPACGRSRALVFLLRESHLPSTAATLVGAGESGHAICAAVTTMGNQTLAAIGDLGGAIELWNLSEATNPFRLARWCTPPALIDGQTDSILDVEFVGSGAATELLAAAGRRGLVRLGLGQAGRVELELLEIHDTPGWATGLAVQERGEEWRVLVGDQKCGARLLRWKPGNQKRK